MKSFPKIIMQLVVILLLILIVILCYSLYNSFHEKKALKKIITRLEADTRIAEVLVIETQPNELTGKTRTKIKFLEYDTSGEPLTPRYFSFEGNIIQFQSLVIRFNDTYVKKGDSRRGKSAYLFLKVFMLDGPNTQEYEITPYFSVPDGYKIEGVSIPLQKKIWESFWNYALDSKNANSIGIKNAQIEAPGTVFLPGTLYTLKIEHDGGIRIDATKLPTILEGERIPTTTNQ
ncbi:hypothetical protein ACFL3D_00880 [Candidatus Omnitrophota bacterium]